MPSTADTAQFPIVCEPCEHGHNTPKANLEFQITWTEGNLLWLQGEPVPDQEKVEGTKKVIGLLKTKLASMKEEGK